MTRHKVKINDVFALAVVILIATSAGQHICSAATPILTLEYSTNLRLPESTHGIARPVAVTYEPVAGETVITDSRSPAIHLVNEHQVTTFTTTQFSNLAIPLDACLDADGAFVFIDLNPRGQGRTIRRLNLHGEPIPFSPQAPSPAWNPAHLVICRDGSLLTLDTDEGTLAKHDPLSGALIWHRDIGGDQADQTFLGRPCEGHDGTIYVPGGELHVVLVFDANGRPITSFGEFGTGPGKMVFPVAVGIGPGNSLIVLDRMRHKIMVHDSDLKLLSEFGNIGSAPGQFYHPNSMAVTHDGRVFVAQGFEGRVQVFQLAFSDQP